MTVIARSDYVSIVKNTFVIYIVMLLRIVLSVCRRGNAFLDSGPDVRPGPPRPQDQDAIAAPALADTTANPRPYRPVHAGDGNGETQGQDGCAARDLNPEPRIKSSESFIYRCSPMSIGAGQYQP